MRIEVDGGSVFIGTGSGHAAAAAATVVFIHGAAHDHTIWVMPARYFARHGMRVAAPDLPGHGRTDGPALASVEALADWMDRVLEAAGVGNAAIVGHSMGGLVAMSLAIRHPKRVRSLALLGVSVPMPVTERLLTAARDDEAMATDMANGWSHSARGRLGGNPNPGFWILGGGARLIARSDPGVHHADLTACNAFHCDPSTIRVPTLVIVGEADQMTPARSGKAVAAAIAGSRVVSLAGCGHAMLFEQPNQVLDALIGNVTVTA